MELKCKTPLHFLFPLHWNLTNDLHFKISQIHRLLFCCSRLQLLVRSILCVISRNNFVWKSNGRVSCVSMGVQFKCVRGPTAIFGRLRVRDVSTGQHTRCAVFPILDSTCFNAAGSIATAISSPAIDLHGRRRCHSLKRCWIFWPR